MMAEQGVDYCVKHEVGVDILPDRKLLVARNKKPQSRQGRFRFLRKRGDRLTERWARHAYVYRMMLMILIPDVIRFALVMNSEGRATPTWHRGADHCQSGALRGGFRISLATRPEATGGRLLGRAVLCVRIWS